MLGVSIVNVSGTFGADARGCNAADRRTDVETNRSSKYPTCSSAKCCHCPERLGPASRHRRPVHARSYDRPRVDQIGGITMGSVFWDPGKLARADRMGYTRTAPATCRTTQYAFLDRSTIQPAAHRLRPGAGSQGSASQYICLSSFRISSFIWTRNFYLICHSLSGGLPSPK